MSHVLSAKQFTKGWLEKVHDDTEIFIDSQTDVALRRQVAGLYPGMVVGMIFEENSTRTTGSHKAAAMRLGMGYNELNLQTSSMGKGETMEETARTLSGQSDILVMRLKKDGEVARLAEFCTRPVVNAGDGKMDHPTQALVDTGIIKRKTGRLGNHRVAFFGDMKNSRAIRATVQALSLYPGNELIFISDPEFAIPDDVRDLLQERKVVFSETSDIVKGVEGVTVAIGSRFQAERLKGPSKRPSIVLGAPALKVLPAEAIILHSLPHNEEIAAEVVRSEPRSVINEQQDYGVPVRMAMFHRIMVESYGAPELEVALPTDVMAPGLGLTIAA